MVGKGREMVGKRNGREVKGNGREEEEGRKEGRKEGKKEREREGVIVREMRVKETEEGREQE